MNKLFTISTIFFVLCFSANAQKNQIAGAKAGGIAEAGLTFRDVWAVHQNQANLAFLENAAVGFNYKNHHFIPDFGQSALAAAIPTSFGTIGLSIYSLGNKNYSENEYGLSFAKAFGEKLSMGIQMNFNQVVFGENYGRKSAFTGEFGVSGQITEELIVSAHIYNPTQTRFSDFDNEKIPTILRTGFAYQFTKKSLFVIEAEKEINADMRAKTGFQVSLTEAAAARIGVLTNPLETTFGMGYHFKKLNIDVASSYHTILGLSPQASLSFSF